jgi:hypothetical protein
MLFMLTRSVDVRAKVCGNRDVSLCQLVEEREGILHKLLICTEKQRQYRQLGSTIPH